RLLGNLLTIGGIYARAGARDEAERVYRHTLELPIADGGLERASAQLSLATLLATRQPRDAVEHYEQALCCLGESLPPATRAEVVRAMIRPYKALDDWVGLAYACTILGLGDVTSVFRDA